MQPLISPVDREARANHYDDDTPTEYTPLLQSYPARRGSKFTAVFVGVLIMFMIVGTIVSLFLFIEEDKKWPVNVPFQMVSRSEWGAVSPKNPCKNITTKPVLRVIITHTNTPSCTSIGSCTSVVKEMQNYYQSMSKLNLTDLPFNFLISPNGITYEGRGWEYCGAVDPQYDCSSISVAAIGNYTTISAPLLIVEEFKAFLDEGIWRKKLAPNYEVIGRPFGEYPESLIKLLRHWKHWKSK